MRSAWQPIADGPAGVTQIVAQLNSAKDYYGSLPCIRAAALAIAAPGTDNDNAGNAQKLAQFVRGALVYVADPINSELTQTPDVLLLAINRDGCARGDCDDHVLLYCSLCESLGIPCEVTAVKSPGSPRFDHVIATACIDGTPTQVDLCCKFGEQPVYSETMGTDADWVSILP